MSARGEATEARTADSDAVVRGWWCNGRGLKQLSRDGGSTCWAKGLRRVRRVCMRACLHSGLGLLQLWTGPETVDCRLRSGRRGGERRLLVFARSKRTRARRRLGIGWVRPITSPARNFGSLFYFRDLVMTNRAGAHKNTRDNGTVKMPLRCLRGQAVVPIVHCLRVVLSTGRSC